MSFPEASEKLSEKTVAQDSDQSSRPSSLVKRDIHNGTIEVKSTTPLSHDGEKSKEASEAGAVDEDSKVEYPKRIRMYLIVLGLAMACTLVFFDMTVISTAIPAITNDFNSISDIGWYGSAYMLTLCSFQLVYGKCYEIFPLKWTFLVAIMFQELGSVVCGSAQSSVAFIIGRAITGIGCSGILIGAWVILAHSAPVRQRAVLTGFIGAFAGVGGIIGPLISGAFTDSHLTWRWSFYIALPFGAVTLALIIFSFKPPQSSEHDDKTLKEKLMEFDYLGMSLFFPCVTCLLLALQWGGTVYPWSSGKVIALLVVCGVLAMAFVGVQIWKGDKAALPPRLMSMRNVAFACFYAACIDSAYYTSDIWLPIYFQAIKGASAQGSGVKSLTLVGAQVISAMSSGYLVTYFGWYNPFMLASTIFSSVGLGLMTTFSVHSGPAKWVTYPLLAGFGVGLGTQQPMMGIQCTLALNDIPAGTAALTLFQNLGPAILMSVANSVFANGLAKNLDGAGGLDSRAIADMGATSLKNFFSEADLGPVLVAYNQAIRESFYVPLAVAAISIIAVAGMKWEKLPED